MSETFGERLKRRRKKAAMTLEELAEAAESTKSYIWELENKPKIRPSAELVYRLARVLGTTVGVLMGEDEPEDIVPTDMPEQDRVFFKGYQELKPQTKQRLKEIMDILAKDEN